MDTPDHYRTASRGRSNEAKAYSAQEKLIKEGKFKEAQQMDVDDVRSKFGEYEGHQRNARIYKSLKKGMKL